MKANWHPADPAAHVCRRPHARVRLAGRARACVRRRARTRARARAVHAQFRAARRIRVRLRAGACASPWTTCIRSRCGRRCSAAERFSCASIPASAAGTITTCARPACTRNSACRLAEADELVALDTGCAGCASPGCTRTPAAAIFNVANWTETGALLAELARRFPDVDGRRSGRRNRRARAAGPRRNRSRRAGCAESRG